MRLSRLLLLSLILCGMAWAQKGEGGNTSDVREKIWSRIMTDGNINPVAPDANFIWVPAKPEIKKYSLKGGTEATVYPNYRPLPTTNSTQSELSIDVHPLNGNIVFASSNATSWSGTSVGTLYGTGIYLTTNGGTTWQGWDDPPFGRNSGDPVSVISHTGVLWEGFIDSGTNDGGQGVAVSTNNGVTWSRYVSGPAPAGLSDLLDKNHMMVDKSPTSPFAGRAYNTWTAFVSGSPNNNKIELTWSSDNGATWSPRTNISAAVASGSHDQGVNVQTGPNGEVYVAWAIYDAWPGGEDAIGFAKSTDGGVTFTPAYRVYSAVNFGIRGNLKPTSIRVASFPSMAVDRSGGPGNGNIYITFPARGVAPAGSDPDILMIKSTDGGATFGAPVRVNNDALNNGKEQYFPWCTVDQSTGAVYTVFYDNRNTTSDSTGVFMTRSTDFGVTHENIQASDQNFRPKPISGLAGGYQGDYIGIAAKDNRVWAYWADDRTGNYQGWVAYATFGPNISHTPLTNTENLNGPYVVSAEVASQVPLAEVKLFWGRGDNNQITDSTTMTNSSGNTYSGNIPGNGQAATYNYYIKAVDNQGGTSYSPAGAPGTVYKFRAETDLTPPTITHTPLGDQFRETWPATVTSVVKDNIGVDTAYVVYKINTSGQLRQFGLVVSDDSVYSGAFDIDTTQIAVGDTMYYRVVAKDVAAAGNLGYNPSANTWHSFRFIADPSFPVINHTAMRDQARVRWPAKVRANVTDNLGVASVKVEWMVNNGAVTSKTFNLSLLSGSTYEAPFNSDTSEVMIGDTIKYRIKATDVSTVGNVTYAPSSGYYAFKIIDALGTVLLLNDDIAAAGRVSTDKIGNGENLEMAIGASAALFNSVLVNEGYVVDSMAFAQLDTTTLDNYDVVILTAGTKTAVQFDNQALRTAIAMYSNRGGKTLVEGGEVGWNYRVSGTTTDRDPFFRQTVLQCSSWVSDMSGTGIFKKRLPLHDMYNTPYYVQDSLTFASTSYGPRDAMRIIPDKPGILKIGSWFQYPDTAGIIAYSPANNDEIRNIYMTFAIGDIVQVQAAKNMIANALNILTQGGGVIPVELTSFTANATESSVVLNWTTASEVNNAGFNIERKASGESSFRTVGYVEGRGTTLEPGSYSYTDKNMGNGTYTYRLKQLDFDGSFEYSNEVEVNIGTPATFALMQNYPNPFNPSTLIKYALPADLQVELSVFNVLGEKVATLVNTFQKAGNYEIVFDASKLSSGVYLYRIDAGRYSSVKKMILTK